MNHWDEIRKHARDKHRLAAELSGGDCSSEALLNAAAQLTGIAYQPVSADDPLLYKTAQAVLHLGVIWFNDEVDAWQARFNCAHEYAHFWLDGQGSYCDLTDLNYEASEDKVALGAKRVEGYSPHERRELEANVFAREFLLPADRLREQFLAGKNAEEIAAGVDVPTAMVIHQLTRALLGPTSEPPATLTNNGSKAFPFYKLDPSQQRAAYSGWKTEKPRPILVDAGPGTGKTRTLVGRIIHLLKDRNVPPSQILALTYSNKAAEEIYARVKETVGHETVNIWVGTFHAFGLELIRKFHDRLNITAKPEVVDSMEAQLLLEQSLGRLALNHYRSLRQPSANLRAILEAISRAKDELITPEQYAWYAEAELFSAGDETASRKAERALEVARVYATYEELLRENNYLDYGDLIFKAATLLRDDPEVREQVQGTYKHILIDEYQDVNTGSRMMLKLLAGDGSGLWVVGDLRQAIYRFRGASPVNMRLLTTEDYPAARVIQLNTNYRSDHSIVRLFKACADRMRVAEGRSQESWRVSRPEGADEVRYKVSVDEETEAEELIVEIERLREAGIEYRDQAVLCRWHGSLSYFSSALERAGIPILYLGNFFERPEIRDLLSIVSLVSEGDGRSLFRLAKFPEYGFSFPDAQALTMYAYERQRRFPDVLESLSEVSAISDVERPKLARLAAHFADYSFNSSSWSVLSDYLFVKSNYLRTLAADESVQAQQKRLAIYQFLLLAYQLRDRFGSEPGDQKRHFLQHVRRLKINGEERQLRQTPDWADGIDAVRMLTIHASKGLEFKAVHLPSLSEGLFPTPPRPTRCPPPKGMLKDEMLDWHDEEEECLFFVGISRARDHLSIYRARQYKGREGRESSLLRLVRGQLPRAIVAPLPPVVRAKKQTEEPAVLGAPRVYSEQGLSVYLTCPLEYYYRYVLRIHDKRSDSAYAQSLLCVHRVWLLIEKEFELGHSIDESSVSAMFEETWKAFGPKGHAYEVDYHAEALAMIRRTLDYRSTARDRILRPTWKVKLRSGEVQVRPDYVELNEDSSGQQVLIQDMRFGQPPLKTPADDCYALYEAAVREAYPGAQCTIQAVYMTNGETRDVQLTYSGRRASLERYERAIQGILRGEFAARPTDSRCPYCPYFFICPAAEETSEEISEETFGEIAEEAYALLAN